MIDALDVVLGQEIRELAYEMVRLEQWARRATWQRDWVAVGELDAERDEVRERRSALMRDAWQPARRRKRRAS